jgi:hypothetical protein
VYTIVPVPGIGIDDIEFMMKSPANDFKVLTLDRIKIPTIMLDSG